MDQFPGLLARDFGLRLQGKATPMAPSTPVHTGSAPAPPPGSGSGASRPPLPADLFGGGGGGLFGDRHSNHRLPHDDVDVFFSGGGGGGASPKRGGPFSSSLPVYDKPVYDDGGVDDIFSGLPGVGKRSSSSFASTARRDDVFGGGGAPYDNGDLLASRGSNSRRGGAAYDHAPPPYDGDILGGLRGLGGGKWAGGSARSISTPCDGDLLDNLRAGNTSGANKKSGTPFGRSSPLYKDELLAGLSGVSNLKHSSNGMGFEAKDASSFDDLIPGFGGSSLPKQKRVPLENYHQQTSVSSTKTTATKAEDPFVVFEKTSTATHSSSGLFTDPLGHIKPSGSSKSNVSSAKDGGVFADIGFDGLTKSAPLFSFDMEKDHKDRSPLETVGKESAEVSRVKAPDDILPRNVPFDNSGDSNQNLPGKFTKHSESYESAHRSGGPMAANPYETSTKINVFQTPQENSGVTDETWLTVSEIRLFTQPTSAPPPSRPPPPPFRTKPPFANVDESSSVSSNGRIMPNVTSSRHPGYLFPRSHNDASEVSEVSSIDELEDFAIGKPQVYTDEAPFGEEEVETTSTAAASAAAMKEAMDRAEAKFKHAREVWERERDLRSSKSRETAQQVRDQDDKEKERLDREREQREREEREKEQRRLKKTRELELEREREREKARQAVERANRAARERAAAEARQKAERAARERAERVAVQRAQAEARERAAAEAKDRAEKLATERERAEAEARERAAAEVRAARERAAREKAAVEAREKTERAAVERAAAEVRARAQCAAVERAAAEARERAAAEARERAATMAKEKQQKNETDLDSFFNMGARATSAPRERSNSYEPPFDTQFQNKGRPSGTQRTPSGSSSIMKRPPSTINIVDDLTSVFRTSPSEAFQEVEGEPEERRRARLEREQRTRQRAAKALAEKNERELQMQREQAERDRVADSLNTEIRRWAAGKEGNLRALLSTLQYVLWPDSGWQPVSLTDLITAASVKKVYRKATLCVHPDKVRSGSVQQKYISEKVFDLLKEAWNKFNSEELF